MSKSETAEKKGLKELAASKGFQPLLNWRDKYYSGGLLAYLDCNAVHFEVQRSPGQEGCNHMAHKNMIKIKNDTNTDDYVHAMSKAKHYTDVTLKIPPVGGTAQLWALR